MKKQLLIEHISKYVKLSKNEVALIRSFLKLKKVRRKQLMLEEMEIQKYGFFVISGCLKSYTLEKNGFERVLQFAPSGWWIGDMFSLKNQEPSRLYIDAVFDSEILLLSHLDLSNLYEMVPNLERCFRLLAENAFAASQRRIIETVSLTALERYENFKTRYPDLFEQLPQKLIASYIGITPEFLSRVLRELSNDNLR
ncbi:Crp/Fnr family transcriptional regulator [Sphingobacterium detergens]|uniref:CRP-like cAMP-binding protein n=1 Tax=Sphingobacterium detergens TaxID=1145106 RepID=A0A420BKR5_SPHD1|nr:Crp/Fnr family transcriptional regulator [Sphingobacterium detergens]RKE57309.1 CRP-like cAMP-binding protein [Sphingobacterium detergens]